MTLAGTVTPDIFACVTRPRRLVKGDADTVLVEGTVTLATPLRKAMRPLPVSASNVAVDAGRQLRAVRPSRVHVEAGMHGAAGRHRRVGGPKSTPVASLALLPPPHPASLCAAANLSGDCSPPVRPRVEVLVEHPEKRATVEHESYWFVRHGGHRPGPLLVTSATQRRRHGAEPVAAQTYTLAAARGGTPVLLSEAHGAGADASWVSTAPATAAVFRSNGSVCRSVEMRVRPARSLSGHADHGVLLGDPATGTAASLTAKFGSRGA